MWFLSLKNWTKGIGEDRAEVEELKKESAKVREEVEKEREMLQLADVLREERVQMKLCEAKYEFEEKNAAIQSLKHHLESYFITQLHHRQNHHQNPQTQTLHHFSSNKFDKIKQLEAYLKKINFGSSQNQTKQTHNIRSSRNIHCSRIKLNVKIYTESLYHLHWTIIIKTKSSLTFIHKQIREHIRQPKPFYNWNWDATPQIFELRCENDINRTLIGR